MHKHRHKFIFFFTACLVIFLVTTFIFKTDSFATSKNISNNIIDTTTKKISVKPKIVDIIKKIEIKNGSTYGKLIQEAGIDYEISKQILEASEDIYHLVNIHIGRDIELIYDGSTNRLKTLIYQVDTQNKLYVEKKDNEWKAKLKKIEYEIKIKVASGIIETSMYAAANENNIDVRAIIEFANSFQWTIDFAMDPRIGDTFKFLYEERYLDGKYIMPGKVLAGEYINAGEKYEIFYFEENEKNKGYFDTEGISTQKMFLKAPLSFKYISSGFTTGRRYVKAFNVSTGHRAIDYAATYGTPIRSVGDGTVVKAGWNGSFGYFISIRHNGTYTTQYAHQSKLAVKKGQKVKQSQIIGYVGSTGFSTGPHLHYEMVKNGVKINPLYEVLPPGEPIKEENRERFEAKINEYLQTLN